MHPVLICTDSKNVLVYIDDGILYARDETSEPIKLLEEKVICVDGLNTRDGKVLIVAATKMSHIVMIEYSSEKINAKTLMVSRSKEEDKIKNIRLFEIENKICLLFILEYGEKNILSLQLYDEYYNSTAKAVDYISTQKDYICCADIEGNIHIVYTDIDMINRYKIFRWSKKDFEDRECSFFENSYYSISAVCDDKRLHLVYTVPEGDYVVLCYSDGEALQKISFGMRSDAEVSVYIKDENIHIMWAELNCIYECFSKSGGRDFTKPCKTVSLREDIKWVSLRCAKEPLKKYYDRGYADIKNLKAPYMVHNNNFNKKPKVYAEGERASEYARSVKDIHFDAEDILKRLDKIELRLEALLYSQENIIERLKNNNRGM